MSGFHRGENVSTETFENSLDVAYIKINNNMCFTMLLSIMWFNCFQRAGENVTEALRAEREDRFEMAYDLWTEAVRNVKLAMLCKSVGPPGGMCPLENLQVHGTHSLTHTTLT